MCEKIGVPWPEIRLERSPRGKPYLASPIKVPCHSCHHSIFQPLLIVFELYFTFEFDCITWVFKLASFYSDTSLNISRVCVYRSFQVQVVIHWAGVLTCPTMGTTPCLRRSMDCRSESTLWRPQCQVIIMVRGKAACEYIVCVDCLELFSWNLSWNTVTFFSVALPKQSQYFFL